MTVNVSKPALNVREKLAELDKPTGIAGEAMLRAETPQEQFNLIGAGRRNLLINGDFEVSQRGNYSSATATLNNQYSLDRWSLALSSVTGTVQHNEVVLPNGTKTMAMKVAGTSTNASIGYLGIRQVIEDFRILSGQIVTASMWIRTNLRSMTFRHDSTTNFGDYVTPDGEWHYHTATYQMPTITSAGRNANQTTLAIINYTGSAGGGVTSGEYFEVAQVQLELGKVATPFEHRSYGEELALCQRYYQVLANNDADLIGVTHKWNSTNIFTFCDLPVEMRTQPSLDTNISTVSAALRVSSSGYNVTGNNLTLDGDSSPRKLRLNTTMNNSNFPSGSSGWLRINNSTIYVNVDAEL